MVKFLCYWLCRVYGWEIKVTHFNDIKSCVVVGAPHTSNWDFFPAMAVCHLIPGKTHYAIKKEWMKFPASIFFKLTGGVGINRKKKEGEPSITDQLANFFSLDESFKLMISPEGTRRAMEQWKTGFYYVAQKAKVPIVVCEADYSRKFAGSIGVIYPSNFEKDMKKLIELYRNSIGNNPEKFKLDQRFI